MFKQRMEEFGQNSPNVNLFVGYGRDSMAHIARCFLLVLSSELGGLQAATVIAAAIWSRSLLIAAVDLSKPEIA